MEQQNRESIEFEEIVQRTVNAEAKAGLRSNTMVRESDARCPRGRRPSHNTFSKVQTQGTIDKEPRTEESRPKKAKLTNIKAPASPHFNEPAKPNCQKKSGSDSKRKKTLPRQQETMPLRLRRRSGLPAIPVRWLATIVKKRATLQINLPNLQKTNINLDNLHAGD